MQLGCVDALERDVLADLAADMWAWVAERDPEGGELAGDLEVGQRWTEGDVGVAAVVVVPGAEVAGDGADADHDAVGDVDHRAQPGAAGGGDGEPFAVGLELELLGGAGFAVAAVGGVGLRAGVAVDDQGAVAAVAVGVQGPVEGAAPDPQGLGDLGDGVPAGVIHLLGGVELALRERRRAAADAAAGPRGRQAVEGAVDDHLPVVLG